MITNFNLGNKYFKFYLKRHRGGYEDGDYTLYHKLNATDFINGENFIELLAKSNEVRVLLFFLHKDSILKMFEHFLSSLDCFRWWKNCKPPIDWRRDKAMRQRSEDIGKKWNQVLKRSFRFEWTKEML